MADNSENFLDIIRKAIKDNVKLNKTSVYEYSVAISKQLFEAGEVLKAELDAVKERDKYNNITNEQKQIIQENKDLSEYEKYKHLLSREELKMKYGDMISTYEDMLRIRHLYRLYKKDEKLLKKDKISIDELEEKYKDDLSKINDYIYKQKLLKMKIVPYKRNLVEYKTVTIDKKDNLRVVFIPIGSSWIKAMGHDIKTSTLYVAFTKAAKEGKYDLYRYFNISLNDYKLYLTDRISFKHMVKNVYKEGTGAGKFQRIGLYDGKIEIEKEEKIENVVNSFEDVKTILGYNKSFQTIVNYKNMFLDLFNVEEFFNISYNNLKNDLREQYKKDGFINESELLKWLNLVGVKLKSGIEETIKKENPSKASSEIARSLRIKKVAFDTIITNLLFAVRDDFLVEVRKIEEGL